MCVSNIHQGDKQIKGQVVVVVQVSGDIFSDWDVFFVVTYIVIEAEGVEKLSDGLDSR